MAVFYINDTLGNEYRFRHDSLGRKIQLEDPDVGTYYYKYDLTGNLVQQVGGGGNLITGDGFYREYNELNQLIRVRNGSNSTGNILEEYTYDPYGNRVKIKRYDAANTTVYTPYREWTRIANISGTYDFTYIYDGSTLVGRINPDGSKHYFHDDHLGSVSLITNQSGAIIEQTFFEPFGSIMQGGTTEDKLYTGQFSDDLTGQYSFGGRYYLPGEHLFTSVDQIFYDISRFKAIPKSIIYNPQGLNKYSYTLNNPYVYIDPSGYFSIYIGGGYQAGSGIGAVGSQGYVLSITFSRFEMAKYDKKSESPAAVSPSASIYFELGFAPFHDSVEDFSGRTADVGGDVTVPAGYYPFTSIGLEASVPLDEKGRPKWKKASAGVTGSPLDINPPYIPASGYATVSNTEITPIFSIGDGSGPAPYSGRKAGETVNGWVVKWPKPKPPKPESKPKNQ